jgi:2-polyprenyl-3-methyl-5-hydroxy-6-metoxy-1,4-benzoquinol methylase
MRRRSILSCLAAPLTLLRAQDDERVWRDYLDWVRRQPIGLADPRSAYLAELKRQGLDEHAAQARLSLIERMRRARPDDYQRAFFDRTYRSTEPRFQSKPNELLAETVKSLKPGLALDIHMGQGRNAIHLARLGWKVTGFDYSREGVETARKSASSAGVRIEAVVARHEDFDFGNNRWDLIVMSYTWVPLAEPWTTRIVAALKPGAILVFEHLMDSSGSDNAAVWLPRPNQLLQTFAALRILRYEDVRRQADWSWRPERVARLVAEKSEVSGPVHRLQE